MTRIVKEEQEEEEEVFFEAVDSISESAESDDVNENSVYKESEYEIWMSEPQSVQQRRKLFIHGMGMDKTSSTDLNLKCTVDSSDGDESSSDAVDDSLGENNPSFSSEFGSEDEKFLCCDRFEQDQFDEVSTSSSGRVSQSQPLSFLLASERQEENTNDYLTDHNRLYTDKKKKNWIELLLAKNAKKRSKPKPSQMKVSPENKKCIEFSAVYVGQKIKAHSGCIRVMKISPDGHYLASGGEDGVIRIWLITSADGDDLRPGKLNDGKKSLSAPVVIPDKLFRINEYPLHEFCGHSDCVVGLSWSKSNHLISSSKDGTVRLWKIGMDNCLNVFHHSDPVTCVQFNPVDDDYFISGSIDGKVRVWGTFKGRVTDWIDVRDVITAICYQPDGTGVVVGSSTGICRFYGYSGDDLHLQLEAQVHIHGKKKTLSNKITSIQFSVDEIQRIMITSDDSVVRILDGVNIVHKYKGLRKSSSQISASFTPTGQHIISLDTDSRIYVWNYDGTPSSSFKKLSTRSCEHFLFKDVSVAIPWSPLQTDQTSKSGHLLNPMSFSHDSNHHPLGSWLPIDVSFGGGDSTTWPEDLLPSPDWDVPITQNPSVSRYHSFPMSSCRHSALSDTWGLVIVTASKDGLIRTFHNYGLPTGTRSRLVP